MKVFAVFVVAMMLFLSAHAEPKQTVYNYKADYFCFPDDPTDFGDGMGMAMKLAKGNSPLEVRIVSMPNITDFAVCEDISDQTSTVTLDCSSPASAQLVIDVATHRGKLYASYWFFTKEYDVDCTRRFDGTQIPSELPHGSKPGSGADWFGSSTRP